MRLFEFIQELQELYEKEGDSELVIDIPEYQGFVFDFSLCGMWYQGNWYDSKGKLMKHSFIIIKKED